MKLYTPLRVVKNDKLSRYCVLASLTLLMSSWVLMTSSCAPWSIALIVLLTWSLCNMVTAFYQPWPLHAVASLRLLAMVCEFCFNCWATVVANVNFTMIDFIRTRISMYTLCQYNDEQNQYFWHFWRINCNLILSRINYYTMRLFNKRPRLD